MTITEKGRSESLFEDPIQGKDENNAAAEQERDKNSGERQLPRLSVSAERNMTHDNFLELRNAGLAQITCS